MTPSIEDDEALINQFRDWLREARAEAEAGAEGSPEVRTESPIEPIPDVGLYRLVEEFTALRHEVKLETKGSRSLIEQVEALLPAVRQAVEHIRAVSPREDQAVVSAARPMAEAMADLDEALDRGRLEIEKARDRIGSSAASLMTELDASFQGLPWFRRIGLGAYQAQLRDRINARLDTGRDAQFASLLEGYALIQARLRKAMEAGQVRRIDAVGLAVDPSLMSVVEVVEAPGLEPGQVVDEVRRGYTWRGRVLRFAEVRAAREQIQPSSPLEAD